MQPDIVTYTYLSPKINTARHTDRMYLDELIVYILGERLMQGMSDSCELDGTLLQYLHSCLDILDKPNVGIIYDEIRRRVESLSADYVYQSLLSSGEFYLKYDYRLSRKITRLQIYVDPSETSWKLW